MYKITRLLVNINGTLGENICRPENDHNILETVSIYIYYYLFIYLFFYFFLSYLTLDTVVNRPDQIFFFLRYQHYTCLAYCPICVYFGNSLNSHKVIHLRLPEDLFYSFPNIFNVPVVSYEFSKLQPMVAIINVV